MGSKRPVQGKQLAQKMRHFVSCLGLVIVGVLVDAVAAHMHDGGDAPTHTPLSRIKGAQAKQKKKSEEPLLQDGGGGRPRVTLNWW